MKKMLTIFLCLCLFDINADVAAQSLSVGGRVTDLSGNPVVGATVLVKGTTHGTITDADGSYKIGNVATGSVIRFSCIGNVTQEITFKGNSPLDVALENDSQEIEKVVIVGYGQAKAKDLTSPIATISGAEVTRHTTSNVMDALQGKLAGVQITSNGTPGSSPSVRIRGIGSFNNEGPLYVVDGMFYDNIDFLSPNDIGDISLLKDASSAAIYGVRASNGVIIVTTKKGGFNKKAVVSYDGYAGVQRATNMLKMADNQQYATMLIEREQESGDADILNILNQSIEYWGGKDGVPATNTDWYKSILRVAPVHSHSVDVSGGTEKAAYSMGINYFKQEGIMNAKSDFERFNFRTKADYKPYSWLKLGANVILSRSKRNMANNSAWERAYYAPPVVPVYDENYAKTFPVKFTDFDRVGLNNGIYSNPAAMAYYGDNISEAVQILPAYYMDINILKDEKLVFKTSYNQDITFSSGRSFMPEYYLSSVSNSEKSSLRKSNDYWSSYILDNTLTYRDNFGKHNLTAMVGASMRNEDWRSLYGSGLGVPGSQTEYQYLTNADPTSLSAGDNGTTYRSASFFGRAAYNYDHKYLLTLTMRADGSSKYQQKWGYFPSAGAAWVMSEENFMKNSSFVDFLKLRASYGILGNDKVPASNGFASVASGLEWSGVFGGQLIPGMKFDEYFTWLKWEVVSELNAGFEVELFKNRLKVDVDYFDKLTENAVIAVPIPGTPNSLADNMGEIRNRGIEGSFSWSDVVGEDFRYNLGFNISTLKNTITGLKDTPYVYGGSPQFRSINRVGESMYSYYGYKVTGVYQTEEEIAADPIAVKNNLQPGDLKFENLNDDDTIDDRDRQILGSPLPTLTYGGNIDLGYKNWDLGVTFMGVYGNQIINQKRGSRGTANLMNYEASVVADRWHGAGTSNSSPSAAGLNRSWNYSTLNSYFVESGSYFRIQNIQLGYTFNASNNWPLIRLNLTAERPYTNFRYHGFTPEVAGGFDNQTYPLSSIYSVGLKVTF